MQTRRLSLAISALALAAASFAANAGITFTNLGTAAPPATVGPYVMTAFDTAPQAAIDDFSVGIINIPGSPIPGTLGVNPGVQKYTAGDTWGSPWAHGYAGPVFYSSQQQITLTLPANTHAFYFYTQGNYYGTNTFTATTDSGASSGPVSVLTDPEVDGSVGFAFNATAGETLATITISAPAAGGFAVAEFGVDTGLKPTTTCASSGYTGTQLLWCVKICESGLTGKALDDWIHRWIRQFRQLPYCALPGGGNPPPQGGEG